MCGGSARIAAQMVFHLVDQTKLVTAASELARNTLIYGGGGEMSGGSAEWRAQRTAIVVRR